ncbi:MAG: F0F1 ATP synthase subunit B [Candidatus Levybacteria bacterium]|nr:F0F1 ATP synthase subunit B [Candidatus Levybacteria bacterium]
MDVLHDFGIEPVLLVAQIVNFLIIAYVLKRFAYKPVLNLLKERKKTIEMGLQQAEQARKLLEQANEKESALLKNAQMTAKKMQDDAKKQSDEILSQTKIDAKKMTEQMLTEAKQQIVQETKDAEKRLEAHVSTVAIAFLEKAVTNLFTEKDQKAVMEKAVKQLKGAKD